MSYAVRLKVGCVIVKNGNIIAMGWNGTATGEDNCCEETVNGELSTKLEVSHAEENALMKLTASTISSIGSTIYLTHTPCVHCAKMINNSQVKRVVYCLTYRDDAGVNFLKSRGIQLDQFHY
jgi:dCMP deaminase